MTKSPLAINYKKKSKQLEVVFKAATYLFSAEFLRVHSPSAEVQGHSPEQRILQLNKQHVAVDKIIPAGRYGIRIHFSDGHDTGIYTWQFLEHAGINYDQLWQTYLDEVASQETSTLTWVPPSS